MWKSDGVFSHHSICTELHCTMYCCWQILTNIRFVTHSTVPTSCLTVNVTFTVLDTLSLCTKHNCMQNTKLQRTCAVLQSISQWKNCNFSIKQLSVIFYFNLNLYLNCVSTKSVIQQLWAQRPSGYITFVLPDLKTLAAQLGGLLLNILCLCFCSSTCCCTNLCLHRRHSDSFRNCPVPTGPFGTRIEFIWKYNRTVVKVYILLQNVRCVWLSSGFSIPVL